VNEIDLERILELMTEEERRRYDGAPTEESRQQVVQAVVNRIGLDVSLDSKAQVPVSGEVANTLTPTVSGLSPLVSDSTSELEGKVDARNQELIEGMGGSEKKNILIRTGPSVPEIAVRERGETKRRPGGFRTKEIDADDAVRNLTQSWLAQKPVNGISYDDIRRSFILNGVVTPDASYQSVLSRYKEWTNFAAFTYENGKGAPMSLEEMVDIYGDREGKAYAASLGMAGGPTTSTTKTYTEYDVESALSIAEAAYGKALGRKPSKKQIQNVVNELNRRAKAAPSVATTTRGGAGETVVNYGGGISPTEIAEQVAEADPLFAETDFVSNFLPIVEKVFKNPVMRGV
jgi:hypothetical protein